MARELALQGAAPVHVVERGQTLTSVHPPTTPGTGDPTVTPTPILPLYYVPILHCPYLSYLHSILYPLPPLYPLPLVFLTPTLPPPPLYPLPLVYLYPPSTPFPSPTLSSTLTLPHRHHLRPPRGGDGPGYGRH